MAKWFRRIISLLSMSPKCFRVLKPFTDISWYDGIDLNQYLQTFSKSKQTSDQLKTRRPFRILLSSGHGRDDRLAAGPYRDAFYTVALYEYTNTADQTIPEYTNYLACIGFDVKNRAVVVKQIQGNPGKGGVLNLFKWERMLLTILTDWARQNCFAQVRVVRAKGQKWFCPREEERTKRMFMHYDVTARRSGFRFDQAYRQYVKDLA